MEREIEQEREKEGDLLIGGQIMRWHDRRPV
jgi:hypothetical protein